MNRVKSYRERYASNRLLIRSLQPHEMVIGSVEDPLVVGIAAIDDS